MAPEKSGAFLMQGIFYDLMQLIRHHHVLNI